MQKFTIAVFVRNKFGVLNRVTNMFRRRRFNIDSLTVSETESPDYSRITITFDGEESNKQKLINQLNNLLDVCAIKELKGDNSVSSELLLIKMKNSPQNRADIQAAAAAFHAKTVDYTRESIIMKLTANTNSIDDFLNLMRDYTILEICRTGVVSLERGSSVLNSEVADNENNL